MVSTSLDCIKIPRGVTSLSLHNDVWMTTRVPQEQDGLIMPVWESIPTVSHSVTPFLRTLKLCLWLGKPHRLNCQKRVSRRSRLGGATHCAIYPHVCALQLHIRAPGKRYREGRNKTIDALRTEALFLRLWPGDPLRSASTFLTFLCSVLNHFPAQQTSQGSWYSISTDVFNLVYPENAILSRNQGHLRGLGYAF